MDRQKTTDRPAFSAARRCRFCVNVGIGGVIVIGILSAHSVGTETHTHARDAADFQKYRVILERNIFNPGRGVDQKEERAGQEPPLVPAAPPADIKVVGIVQREDSLLSIAIVEESGRHRMCRIGDTVGAMVIRDIRRDALVLETSGGRWIAEIQPGTMDHRAVTLPTARGIAAAVPARRSMTRFAGGRLPIKAADVPHLVKEVGSVIDAHEEAAQGLRLTRDFIGLREGDRVTHVGRQSLCTGHPRQKLWQIARKYSTYGREMPEIPIRVQRKDLELEYVLSLSL